MEIGIPEEREGADREEEGCNPEQRDDGSDDQEGPHEDRTEPRRPLHVAEEEERDEGQQVVLCAKQELAPRLRSNHQLDHHRKGPKRNDEPINDIHFAFCISHFPFPQDFHCCHQEDRQQETVLPEGEGRHRRVAGPQDHLCPYRNEKGVEGEECE